MNTAALTQSHVWGLMSRKPGTTECFPTGTHNGWPLRVVLCSVLSMWCLNWTFSWSPKGNSFKRKNFKFAKSQIMAQHRKTKDFVSFILKYKSLNASKHQPPVMWSLIYEARKGSFKDQNYPSLFCVIYRKGTSSFLPNLLLPLFLVLFKWLFPLK